MTSQIEGLPDFFANHADGTLLANVEPTGWCEASMQARF